MVYLYEKKTLLKKKIQLVTVSTFKIIYETITTRTSNSLTKNADKKLLPTVYHTNQTSYLW